MVEVQTPGAPVRLVQITDFHLCAKRGGKLLGMDTDHSLQAVIDLVQRERDRVDLVLATGDLADDGAPEAYARLPEYFDAFPCRAFLIPGNHDDRAAMTQACRDSCSIGRELHAGNWQILMLDSQVPGEVGGELGPTELAWLEKALGAAQARGMHSLVVLHHQPVPVGCAWLDEQIVADAAALFDILDARDSVRAVVWGHVHQETDIVRNGVRLLSSPSTCVQFAPNSVDFLADDRPPGYRWLDLYADGRVDSGVSRVEDVAFTVNIGEGGYL
ncbi:MAG: 3',5'-cyclic-AMP phosphodiesterase [Halioglobus sp.]